VTTISRVGVFVGLGVLATAVVYLLAFAYVVGVSRQDHRAPTDAIVVLGAAQYDGRPSPVLQARLDHALALYHQHVASQIVLTGGIGTGDTASEAVVGRRYLQSRNVPPEALVVRPEGRSTEASIRSVANWMHQEGHRTILFVSDPFHMARLRLEARRMGIEAYTSPTRTSPISQSFRREVSYFASEAFKIPIAWIRSR
jgi:uncharacterized SAM-binding protein YcdF (DUF218 family)